MAFSALCCDNYARLQQWTKLGNTERRLAMYPLHDMVWAVFFRGVIYGLLAAPILIVLLFSPLGSFGKRGIPQLVFARPIGLVYFLAGAEVGIAIIGTLLFVGLYAWQIHVQRLMEKGGV